MNFKLINFHNNTEYSFLESTITLKSLFDFAIQNQQKYLVITDHNNMFGVAPFLKLAQKHAITPIIGLDCDVDDYRLILIAKNYQGFLELARLSNRKMSKENITLNDINVTNLIVIDHPSKGYFAITKKQLAIPNYYVIANDLSITNAIWVQEHVINKTNENQYLKTLQAIAGNEVDLKSQFRGLSYIPEDLNPEIISRTNALVEQIDLQFPEVKNPLPHFPNDLGIDSFSYLKKVLEQSLQSKKAELIAYPELKERLKTELEVIKTLNFADYFLIIWDFIKWAKNNEIVIGPGRGSSAGSLVCYLLNITEVNPLKYNLLFERFLNIKRVSMPDIDIDIQDNRREEIINYVINKYGNDNVASIVTFQTLGAKMALRDVARVLGISIAEVNELSKMVPSIQTLEETYEKIAKFRAKIDSKPIYKELYETAKFLEGLPRQHGTHAAGVIVSDKKIIDIIPTMFLENGQQQTQFSMDYLEEFGLLKIDFLGLKNLSTLKNTLDLINQRHHLNLTIAQIPLNDVKTKQLLSSGKTIGIFQLESPGMINTIKAVKIDQFEDLAAIISLFRPGPMEMIPTYIKNKKNPDLIPFVSQEYNQILSSTYGVIVYQEQIMEICQKFSGMSFSDADILRKAISKKDFSEIAEVKQKFFQGALANNYSLALVNQIFELIEKFAAYGFNKSHAISYAMLGYKMAYLKSEYPLEFFASAINTANGAQATVEKYYSEAKSLGIKIESPLINKSSSECFIEDNKIYLPLNIVKGLGKVAIDKIESEIGKNGPFMSFYDFIVRAELINLGRANITTIIESNALRQFGNIKTLLNNLDAAFSYSDLVTITNPLDKTLKTVDHSIAANLEIVLNEVALDAEFERKMEEKYLGYAYNNVIINPFETETLLADLAEQQTMRLALVVNKISPFYDKYQREMGRLILSDRSKTINVLVFSTQWKNFQSLPQGEIVYFDVTNKGDRYIVDKNWMIAKLN
ncbi:DNA polymerase III subunit alpha [Candidatus Mycoplasma pogonae]